VKKLYDVQKTTDRAFTSSDVSSCRQFRAGSENGTVSAYDKESRMVTVKGKDWEQKAKVSSDDAKGKADLLKADTKVKVMFDDRGGGDVRVKSIETR
jgi:hypothetical protein